MDSRASAIGWLMKFCGAPGSHLRFWPAPYRRSNAQGCCERRALSQANRSASLVPPLPILRLIGLSTKNGSATASARATDRVCEKGPLADERRPGARAASLRPERDVLRHVPKKSNLIATDESDVQKHVPPRIGHRRSIAMRRSVAIIRAPATSVPRSVPDTLDSPPVRQR
jgi:hypothetical protein